jgi:hypothetical protein
MDANRDSTVAELVDEWASATFNMSSTTQIKQHQGFARLVGLGRPAIPAIIRAYRNHACSNLCLVLRDITGEDVVPEQDWGDSAKTRQHWIDWYERQR